MDLRKKRREQASARKNDENELDMLDALTEQARKVADKLESDRNDAGVEVEEGDVDVKVDEIEEEDEDNKDWKALESLPVPTANDVVEKSNKEADVIGLSASSSKPKRNI